MERPPFAESPTLSLGRFAADLKTSSLPAEVTGKLGELFLDYLRVASIGARLPWSEWAREYQLRMNGRGRSAILYSRKKTNPLHAAFLNATYAGSFDSDDTHVGAMLHPGAVVFSAAFATATDVGASGAQFLAAVTGGYEAMIRIALSIQPSHFQRGFQSTATCGGFGATVAASMLLSDGEDPAQRVSDSIGVVASFAGGLTQFYYSGSTVKRIHAAHAAASGVSAAYLVDQGFSGPIDVLEGSNGFARAYADEVNFDLLMNGLGRDFRLMEVMVKGHACSARVQAAVEAIFELAKNHLFGPDEVASITVGVPAVIAGHLTHPRPADLQAAQMSLPFSVALAVCKIARDREATTLELADFESGLRSDSVRAIEDRVRWQIDPEVESATTPEAVPAKVVIKLNSGREVALFVDAPRGSPGRPVTNEQQLQRFRSEVGQRLSATACESLINFSRNLEELDSIGRVAGLLESESK
ncbi:MAG TPA: MmgE/PrpD family protein [Candidatus Acidoferrales bacterium]|nr:MmgE/PrpD family protein [Candidatus Acidoferrales bacterium]